MLARTGFSPPGVIFPVSAAILRDRQVSLFVRLCMQNGERLSKGKSGRFAELGDSEIEAMAAAVRDAMGT